MIFILWIRNLLNWRCSKIESNRELDPWTHMTLKKVTLLLVATACSKLAAFIMFRCCTPSCRLTIIYRPTIARNLLNVPFRFWRCFFHKPKVTTLHCRMDKKNGLRGRFCANGTPVYCSFSVVAPRTQHNIPYILFCRRTSCTHFLIYPDFCHSQPFHSEIADAQSYESYHRFPNKENKIKTHWVKAYTRKITCYVQMRPTKEEHSVYHIQLEAMNKFKYEKMDTDNHSNTETTVNWIHRMA